MPSFTKQVAVSIGLLALFLIPMKKEGKVSSLPKPDSQTPDTFRRRIVTIAESQVGQPNLIDYSASALGLDPAVAQSQGIDKLSWCGFFTTWVLQQAGAEINWVLGKGVAYQLQRTYEPRPGDIAYIDQPYQHHAIVSAVDGDTITTIDGNSLGGKVAINKRPRSAFDGFYDVDSIDPQARDTVV